MEFFFVLFPLFVVAIVVFAIVGHIKEKERRQRLETYARAKGWQFNRERRRIDQRFPEFDFLRRGSNRYAYHLIRGGWEGMGVLAFDYHYQTESRDSEGKRKTHHHHFSVVLLSPSFELKPIQIRPEGLFDRVKAAFGWDDINFESAEFSRRYHVKAGDRRWAYDFLNPRTIDYLLKVPPRDYQIAHGCLAITNKHRMEPPVLEEILEVGKHLIGEVPDFARVPCEGPAGQALTFS